MQAAASLKCGLIMAQAIESISANAEASLSFCFAGVTNAHKIAISTTQNSSNQN